MLRDDQTPLLRPFMLLGQQVGKTQTPFLSQISKHHNLMPQRHRLQNETL